jgi:hypothetical protein
MEIVWFESIRQGGNEEKTHKAKKKKGVGKEKKKKKKKKKEMHCTVETYDDQSMNQSVSNLPPPHCAR